MTSLQKLTKKYGVNRKMGTKIKRVGVKREKGYLYYVDTDGDVARAKMGKKKK